jgi:hypothetical protein
LILSESSGRVINSVYRQMLFPFLRFTINFTG